MPSPVRRHLSYANVVSTLALFAALAGSGYAAATSAERSEAPRVASAQASAAARGGTAYGRVNAQGVLSRSSNVVGSVGHPRAGTYCIRLDEHIDASQTGVVATADYSNDSSSFHAAGEHAIVEWRGGRPNCSGNAVEINTARQRSDGSLESRDQGFYFSTAPVTRPRATAVVLPDGRFDKAYTRGFTAVRKLREDIFCLAVAAGIDPRRDPASVAVVYNFLTQARRNALLALWAASPNPNCKPSEYEVRTVDFSSGSGEGSGNVTFSIIVP